MWIPQRYAQDNSKANGEVIIHVADNASRVDLRKSCCDEYLCAVRQQSLGEARHRVKYAGSLSRVDVVFLRQVFCQASHSDDGNGVVGGADVNHNHHSSNAVFR